MRSLTKAINKRLKRKAASGIVWINVPAIVAENEDPEHRHRIKVKIPLIDEERVHDEWIEHSGIYSGSGGYGIFIVPKIDSEVRLTGEQGQNVNLSYHCVYNENNMTPGDGNDETTAVLRFPADLKIICRGDLMLEGGRVLVNSAFGTIQISAASGLIIDPADEGGA